MTDIVFFLTRLQPGVHAEDYEAWVQAVDYPRVARYASVLDYSVMRVESPLSGDRPPYDYIERVVVTSVDEYQQERASQPDHAEFRAEIRQYMAPDYAFVARTVGTPP
jgi:hypothetical protein